MNEKRTPTLLNNKVMMREINVPQDAHQWYVITKAPVIHKWVGTTVPKNIKNSWDFLDRYKNLDHMISWSIIDNYTKKMIGIYWILEPVEICNKRIIPAEAQIIAPYCWRQGFTKVARKLVYEYAFEVLCVDEIHAQAWKDNINSCFSMEKAGFVLYKEEEKTIEKYDSLYIERDYILTKDTWTKVWKNYNLK